MKILFKSLASAKVECKPPAEKLPLADDPTLERNQLNPCRFIILSIVAKLREATVSGQAQLPPIDEYDPKIEARFRQAGEGNPAPIKIFENAEKGIQGLARHENREDLLFLKLHNTLPLLQRHVEIKKTVESSRERDFADWKKNFYAPILRMNYYIEFQVNKSIKNDYPWVLENEIETIWKALDVESWPHDTNVVRRARQDIKAVELLKEVFLSLQKKDNITFSDAEQEHLHRGPTEFLGLEGYKFDFIKRGFGQSWHAL